MTLSLAIRYVLLGMLAFICACVAHEAIGHGGACLATGGRIVLLTSVYARCAPGAPVIDAAGPLMNLVFAGIAWPVFAWRQPSSTLGLLAVFVFAFNAMWGTGYFIYSAVLGIGDLAFVWRDVHAAPAWLWRLLLGAIGVVLYRASLRVLAPCLPPKLPVLVAYISAGTLAVVSVTFANTELVPAMREAVSETLLASVGLAYLALFPRRVRATPVTVPVHVSGWFTMAAVLIIVAFLWSLGRGLSW
jgi:hypothetical protein